MYFNVFYRQCEFKHGTTHMTCWVEERPTLKLGAIVDFKDGVTPAEGWEVIFISDMRLEESWVKAHEMDHRKNRKASDI